MSDVCDATVTTKECAAKEYLTEGKNLTFKPAGILQFEG